MRGNVLSVAIAFALSLSFSSLIASPAAHAQTAPAASAATPQATTATYDDWLLRCEAPQGAAKICEVVQGIQAQGQQGLVAQIVVGRLAKADPFRLIVQLPAGVWLPAGVAIEFGDKTAPLALTYTRCLQACFADLALKPEQLDALKARSTPVRLVFEDGARNKVQLPVSLKGFAPALEASLKG